MRASRAKPFPAGGWLVLAAIWTAAAGAIAGEPARIVFVAPGYPGSTEQAQPTMDALAAELPEGVVAAYHESEADGARSLSDPDTVAAIVTTPFYLAHRAETGLSARLEAIAVDSPEERWTLVAAAGRVEKPSDLSGWEIASLAGYAPAFVRGPALADWGALPADASIAFTTRPLSALRRASRGEPVAVLLDAAQFGALDRLPYADALETVHRSEPMPGSLLCVVEGREDRAAPVLAAMAALGETDRGAAALESIRLRGFRELDEARLAALEERFRKASRP